MKKAHLLLAVSLMLTISSLSQQTHYEKGWESFVLNDLGAAREHFLKATGETPDKADAWLMLSVLSSIYLNDAEALEYFIKFAEVQDDISPYILGHFYSRVAGFGYQKHSPRMVEFLNSLLASRRLDLKSEGHVLEILGGHYFKSNNRKKAAEYFSQIASVTQWQVAGMFNNVSESGFDKDHEPITNPEASAKFLSDNHASIGWFNLKHNTSGKWVDLTKNFSSATGIAFAQTFCESPAEQEVVMRVGTSGSLKLWVNDKLLFSQPEERNNGMDTYYFTAKLNQGNNRILLQTGSGQIANNNFLLRISDRNDKLIENLKFDSNYNEYVTDESDYVSEIIEMPTERYFRQRIEDDPETLLNYMLLINSYLSNDKGYKAIEVIEQARALAPGCSFFVDRLLEAHYRTRQYSLAAATIEELKAADSLNPLSLQALYSRAVRNENYKEAETINNRLIGLTGLNKKTLANQIDLAFFQNQTGVGMKLIDDAFRKFPQDHKFFALKLEKESMSGNSKRAERMLKKFLKNNYDADLYTTYALMLASRGKLTNFLDVIQQMINNEPENPSNYYVMGIIYQNMFQYYKALGYFRKCQELAPFEALYYDAAGECYEEMGITQAAIDAYKKSLSLMPSDHDLRIKIRDLENKKPFFDYFETPNIQQIIRDAPPIGDYLGYEVVTLHREKQVVVFDAGGSIEKHFLLTKVLNSDGVERYKEQYINAGGNSYLNVLNAEIVKPNGARIPAEQYYDKLFFTSLEVGDIISISYIIERYNSGRFTNTFIERNFFNRTEPSISTKYSLLTSMNLNENYVLTNSDIQPEITYPDKELRMYTWQTNNKEGIKTEFYMPVFADVAENIFFSNVPNWNFYVQWYSDLIYNKIKPDYYIRKKAEELFDGNEDLPDFEKANIIYKFVTTEISYSYQNIRQSGMMPQKASIVLTTRMGDCKDMTALFIALCNTQGIDAKYVLTADRKSGANPSPLPSFVFDHTISQVIIDGDEYYVELTSAHLPFGALFSNTKGAFALLIDPAIGDSIQPFILNPENRIRNTCRRITEVTLFEDSIMVNCDVTRGGNMASSIRSSYKNATFEDRFKTLEKAISTDKVGVRLHSFNFDSTLYSQSPEINYQYQYSYLGEFFRTTGLDVHTIQFTDLYGWINRILTNSRVYPIELFEILADNDENAEIIVITIPPGKTVIDLPENIDINSELMTFSLTYEYRDNKLVIERILKSVTDRVEPEDYPEFRKAANSIVRSDNQKIVLRDAIQ